MLSLIGKKSARAGHKLLVTWCAVITRVALCAAIGGTAMLMLGAVASAKAPVRGMPFIRSYSLGDIGPVPRGSRLGFDRFGRVAVIHDAVYAVLNDTVWLNIAERGGRDRISMTNVVQAPDGRTYYGARGSWGYVETGADGRLHPVPLAPSNLPGWVATATFSDLIVTERGVYFASWNGVVYWDFQLQKNLFFDVPRISRVFRVGDRVYISAFDAPLRTINARAGTLELAENTGLGRSVVEFAVSLDQTRSLVAFIDGRLVVFDGKEASPWLPLGDNTITGHISALQKLVDGRIATSVTGQGLLLFSTEGELLMALTTSQYHNIAALANREPGVLWVETDDSIEKILYGSPLSAFGQRLGLPIAWPIVVEWNGQIFVASGGKLYRAVAGEAGEPTRFEPAPHQPPRGAWSLAAWGTQMLVGNGYELFAVEPDGSLRPIPSVPDLAHLVMVDESHCYLIGRGEMALLEWRDGAWRESAPRIPGAANPAIVHRVKDSVWIEMGGAGVARLWREHGRLRLDVIPNESWTKGSWVNIGSVDDIVVLSALKEEPHRFFDQKTGSWREVPELQQLLNRSPYWIARLQKDESGVIWAAHNEGLIRFAPGTNGYAMDATSFDLVSDRYPVVRILPGNDVWVVAARSLYHIERSWASVPPKPPQPTLVSMVDLQQNEELLATGRPEGALGRLPYARNSLSFRFFSGTDAWRRSPVYEYRLDEREPWTVLDGSLLSFRRLREGVYGLQVRIAAAQADATVPSTFQFEILPPWHRTWPAYAAFGSAVALALLGVMRWSSYLERRRNRALEELVKNRTHELEATMAKLGEETRKAATLAERDRLANEIHDSVQQGLTGAMLQLDTTLKLPAMSGDMRSRLNVVRNMVAYARQEVQHAVWDMESPLLEGTDLADALRNLTTFVDADGMKIEVAVKGTTVPLDRAVNHNLLRIAQEATTNAFRHARARRISVQLEFRTDAVALGIADDGVGFRPGEVLQDRTGHLGLRGIRTRVKRLGGTLAIESQPGQGTAMQIVVPLDGPAAEEAN
ncbi:sensor histidine kinase [Opitutus terrae]|uniref:Histidine kinase n=1 Tax=Opitutus terrae (strain DSM 11246 / JCM 15787 / PB90-1) TaxID=452637 RepID=B1ZT56_OPITP|nr:sensor histidine kinase [Opitutus terrae]ACB76510.1 histidine kinase [Opitutus terrae PB90-1]